MKVSIEYSAALDAFVSMIPAMKRGSQAAKSLKRQRCHLAEARKALRGGCKNEARYRLALWHEERQVWAHLVGKTK